MKQMYSFTMETIKISDTYTHTHIKEWNNIDKTGDLDLYLSMLLSIYLSILQGGPKKSLWCDLEEKCLWNYI